ncbi:triadin-like [Chenopodium quinoa]|uniref:triadin-like n=1 Tax=Chenopodium quinoa TaxID=63459 RepID=UPI000B7874AF|nr:triadin-like [Chenopodium quinoa]
MGEKFQLTSSMEREAEVEEFYEEIEAPKFVDFTLPNHFSPDDCFWFCSRVGCDQQHMQEMDSEAIYKNFVLRVMAARSPNVRFRRALSRKPPSESKKCPFSAPPKSSKSRLQRLGLVSCSISTRLFNEEKGKTKAVVANVKPASTPKARVKNVAAKYMTSPRMKRGSSPKPSAFRSVRNPMKTSISLPKSKVVSKALVFNSPKKALKKKVSEELDTPISKLCAGVKRLEINSQKKGNVTRKPSKDCTSEKKKLPLDRSRKVLGSSKVKTREVDSKLPISVQSKAKANKRKHAGAAQLEVEKGGNEYSDMEIDDKSRCGSLDLGSATVKPKAEDHSSSQEERTLTSDRPMTGESSGAVSLNTQKTDMQSGTVSDDKDSAGPVSDDKDSAEVSTEAVQAPKADEQSQEKDNTITDDLENQNPGVVSKLEDNDDKENALTSADIRNLNSNNLSKHDAPVKLKVVKTKQNSQKLDKNSKENCPAETGGTQGLKNKKLKPTNPKPFRLRTDERGILKEATLERKVNSHEISSTTSENSQGVSDNKEKGGKKDEGKLKPIKSRYMTLKGLKPKLEKSSGVAKYPTLQKHDIGPQREIDSHVKSQGRSAIEKSKTISRPKESRKQGKEAVEPTKKASEAQKSATKGKRPVTIPREPNFQSLHKPKSCTRNK